MVKSPPQVTGISPKEGPPGTRVVLRGENLGVDARDLIGLRICGIDCLLSAIWKSPKQIVARTGQAKGKGDIIVVTRSGGIGTSTVQFRGFHVQIGPLQESAIWVDETQIYNMMANRGKTLTSAEINDTDDPLGICDESDDKKPTEEELQELLSEGSGNTNLENFDPTWFLLENHQKTSFDDLKSGLTHLKHKSILHEEGPLAFAKTNLSTFLDCFDTLTEMNLKLEQDEKNSKGTPCTAKLEDILLKANAGSEGIYHVVLGRKDKADSTRNALGVLNRFKLLFYLPSAIDRNINKGDYDLVITDYTRTKSLKWLTEIHVFKKVFDEIEERMVKFRAMLHEKLMTLPTTVEEQKKYIRYITHLEEDGDPAWECILNNQNWIMKLMGDCKKEYISKEKEEEEKKNSIDTLLSSPLLHSQNENSTKSEKHPSRVMFVEHLTKIICENFPSLWRLGLSYVTGKLMKEDKKCNNIDPEKQTKFTCMMQDIIVLYSTLIRCAFLPNLVNQSKLKDELSGWPIKIDAFKSWLPVCVRHVRFCIAQLSTLDLPADALDLLHSTSWLLRSSCVDSILNQSIQDVRNLGEREIWTLETDDKHGSTTVLPALFEGVVNEMVLTLQEVVNNKPGEQQLFPENSEETIRTRNSCIQLLQDFSKTFFKLATVKESNKTSVGQNHSKKISNKNKVLDTMPPIDKRLIIVMNNCSLTSGLVISRLVEGLNKHGYPVNQSILPIVLQSYKELDEQLFSMYVEVKAGPVVGCLEQNMHAGKFSWHDCPPLKGVRDYIKESILGFLEIHAEVYSVGPTFIERVLKNIIECTAEELCRLLQCAADFNQNGAMQARLDLEAFELSIGIYKTNKTRNYIKEALKCVPELTPDQIKEKDRLLSCFEKQMKFHLMCFKPT